MGHPWQTVDILAFTIIMIMELICKRFSVNNV